MRETSIGLGAIQFLFTAFLVALVVWLAAGVAAVALIVWAALHIVATTRGPVVAASGAGQVEQRPVEATNWAGVAAALLVAGAAVPFLLGRAVWLTVILAVLGIIAAFIAGKRAGTPRTALAMRIAALLGAAVALFALIGLWADRPITLYGVNHGDRQGEMTSIEQLEAELPCADTAVSPAATQRLFAVDTAAFERTLSCSIHRGEEVHPVVFVQASSSAELEEIFASGVITAGSLHDHEVWVERNGAVAVITADEDSQDLAHDAGATWINLDDEP